MAHPIRTWSGDDTTNSPGYPGMISPSDVSAPGSSPTSPLGQATSSIQTPLSPDYAQSPQLDQLASPMWPYPPHSNAYSHENSGPGVAAGHRMSYGVSHHTESALRPGVTTWTTGHYYRAPMSYDQHFSWTGPATMGYPLSVAGRPDGSSLPLSQASEWPHHALSLFNASNEVLRSYAAYPPRSFTSTSERSSEHATTSSAPGPGPVASDDRDATRLNVPTGPPTVGNAAPRPDSRVTLAAVNAMFSAQDAFERYNRVSQGPGPRHSPNGVVSQRDMEELERIRKKVRGRRAFALLEAVDIETLDESDKCCNICYNDFGVESPEGVTEKALKTPKCGHVFGDHCIKEWLAMNDVCPYCRLRCDTTEGGEHSDLSDRSFARMVRAMQGHARDSRDARAERLARMTHAELAGSDTNTESGHYPPTRRYRPRQRWQMTGGRQPDRQADRQARLLHAAGRNMERPSAASPSRSRSHSSRQAGGQTSETRLPSMHNHLRDSLYRESHNPGPLPNMNTLPPLSPTVGASDLPTAVS